MGTSVGFVVFLAGVQVHHPGVGSPCQSTPLGPPSQGWHAPSPSWSQPAHLGLGGLAFKAAATLTRRRESVPDPRVCAADLPFESPQVPGALMGSEALPLVPLRHLAAPVSHVGSEQACRHP